MSRLFGIDVQGIIGAAIGPGLLPGTLHLATTGSDGAGGVARSFADRPIRGIVDSYSAAYRAQAGIPDTDVRLTVLQSGVGAQPDMDCEITLRGVRYRILAIEQDAAQATWTLRGRPT